jgi:GNAT superfamily N-acetyltransferase
MTFQIQCVHAQSDCSERAVWEEQLAHVLINCVEQGASVSFMHPLPLEKAMAFWKGVMDGVLRGERLLLVARDAQRQIQGTVQIITAQPDNQPHRADIAKMLVHSSARNLGLGQALMLAAEKEARAAGKSLLVLDTVTGSAGWRLYQRCGWRIVGDIPGFALWPKGGLVATTFMYKQIA